MRGYYLFVFLLAATAAAQQNATRTTSANVNSAVPTFPPSLYFVPACARECVNGFIPTLLSDFDETCRMFPSANPALNGTTSAENVRQQIAACVWECDEDTNMSPDFRSQLSEICTDKKHGLSPGAIAGIVIGIVCGLLLAVVAAVLFLRCRHQSSQSSSKSERGLRSFGPSPGSQSPSSSFESSGDAEKGQKWTPATTPSPRIDNGGFDFGLTTPSEPQAVTTIYSPTPVSPGAQTHGQTFMAITTETETRWSPVSPVTPPFNPGAPETHDERRNSRVLVPKPESPPPPPMYTQPVIEEGSGAYYYSSSPSRESSPSPPPKISSPPPQLSINVPLSRADSISWRRELQDAAERAATRVSLRVSEPILEDGSAGAERRNGERRASRGSLLSLGRGKGSRRTSLGGR